MNDLNSGRRARRLVVRRVDTTDDAQLGRTRIRATLELEWREPCSAGDRPDRHIEHHSALAWGVSGGVGGRNQLAQQRRRSSRHFGLESTNERRNVADAVEHLLAQRLREKADSAFRTAGTRWLMPFDELALCVNGLSSSMADSETGIRSQGRYTINESSDRNPFAGPLYH
jgi:hypothetical protein